MRTRLGRAVELFREPVSWKVPDAVPKHIAFIDTLKEDCAVNAEFHEGVPGAEERISSIFAIAGAIGGDEGDDVVGFDMRNEQEEEQQREKEKQKEKEKEKEEQLPVAIDLPPTSWNYSLLTSAEAVDAIDRLENPLFYPARSLKLITYVRQEAVEGVDGAVESKEGKSDGACVLGDISSMRGWFSRLVWGL